jgi:hypothetical protein
MHKYGRGKFKNTKSLGKMFHFAVKYRYTLQWYNTMCIYTSVAENGPTVSLEHEGSPRVLDIYSST